MVLMKNLEVHEPAVADRPLGLESERYRIVDASIHIGLCILETKEGRESLESLANFILDELEEKEKKKKDDKQKSKATGSPFMYQDTRKRLPIWIDFFLKSMRADFPLVKITDEVRGEALAMRVDWRTNAGVRELKDYKAGLAGDVSFNNVLIDNMVNCRQLPSDNAYNTFKFQMAISVAHEVVHFFTGFLTGSAKPYTPQKVSIPGYATRARGEAGRYWERLLLGGVMECWSSTDDPLGARQAGSPYLFEHGLSSAEGALISRSYIENFLAHKFTFPIQTEGPIIKRDALKKASMMETTHLRESCRRKKAQRPVSPTPEAGGSIRFRKTSGGNYPGESQAEGSSRSWFRK